MEYINIADPEQLKFLQQFNSYVINKSSVGDSYHQQTFIYSLTS